MTAYKVSVIVYTRLTERSANEKGIVVIQKASLHDVYTTKMLIECPNCYAALSSNDDPNLLDENLEKWEGMFDMHRDKENAYGYCKNTQGIKENIEGCMQNNKPLKIDISEAVRFWWNIEGLTKNNFLLMERDNSLRASSLESVEHKQ